MCVCVKHLNRFKTSPFFFSSFSPSNKGCQSQSRGHGSCFPSHANEAMAFNRKGMWTHIPVPAFIFVWRGAKPRTPKTENFVLHGYRNLRFSSASYSTLFALHFYSHGEGLSREPYSDFPYFGHYLMAFLITMVFSEYLPLFEGYYLGSCVSDQMCT